MVNSASVDSLHRMLRAAVTRGGLGGATLTSGSSWAPGSFGSVLLSRSGLMQVTTVLHASQVYRFREIFLEYGV